MQDLAASRSQKSGVEADPGVLCISRHDAWSGTNVHTVFDSADVIYAPNCLISGAGLYQAVAGVQGSVKIQVADKYNNLYTTGDTSTAGLLSLTLSGPATLSSSGASYIGNGAYSVFYVATTASTKTGTNYTVTATYNSAQISSYASVLQVTPGKFT